MSEKYCWMKVRGDCYARGPFDSIDDTRRAIAEHYSGALIDVVEDVEICVCNFVSVPILDLNHILEDAEECLDACFDDPVFEVDDEGAAQKDLNAWARKHIRISGEQFSTGAVVMAGKNYDVGIGW